MTRDPRTALIIAPHHADRLRRPSAGLVTESVLFRQTLTWNVFRTLELIAPSFWLRRFHVRLTGQASLVPPQILTVKLWPALQLPPIRRIDGSQRDVDIDVLVETEHDVWCLCVPPRAARPDFLEQASDVVDAVGWVAGRRPHHCGVIAHDDDGMKTGSLLKSRYERSRDSAMLRSAARGPAGSATGTWGVVSWSDMKCVLEECARSPCLPAIERALAANAVDWLRSVNIAPAE